MTENPRYYPSVIVTPHVGDYRQRIPRGGNMQPFTDIEAARKQLLEDCELIKDRLESIGQGTQSVGLASLKLRESATSKGSRPREAFTADTCPVIGDDGEPNEMLVLVSPPALEKLSKKVEKLGSTGAVQLTSIESFTLFDINRRFPLSVRSAVEHDLKSKGQSMLKIRVPRYHLFSSFYHEELEKKLLSVLGVEEKPYLEQGPFAIYAVHITNMEQAMNIASFQFIERLAIMPTYTTSGSAIINVANIRLDPQQPINDLPIVAVVDTGIDPNSPLKPLIVDCFVHIPNPDYGHGTSVAALIAAQNGIIQGQLTPRCRLLDVAILSEKEAIDEKTLVRRLEDSLKDGHDIAKHWNLSLSAKTPNECPKAFSDLGMALDNFHKRYGVLFYCAPGNNSSLRQMWPPSPETDLDYWVASPGDTLCNITVGSCAADDSPDDAMAPAGAPSPFSPHGPVAYSVVKPDLVEVGGNIRSNGQQLGVNTIDNGVPSVGTSFSTPQICGLSAELTSYIQRSIPSSLVCNPLLISKALLLHHASIPNSLLFSSDVRLSDFYGYGRPSSLKEMMTDPFWRSTSLICGRLYPDGQEICIEDFPYPDGLSSGDRFWGQVLVTLVTEPIVDPSFQVAYARSAVEAHFGVVRDNGKFETQAFCVHAGRNSTKPLNRKQHRWAPVKQYRGSPNMHCKGEYWRLSVDMSLREKETDIIRKAPSERNRYWVDLVIAVTITDTQHRVQVSNQVAQKWRARGNILSQISTQQRLRSRFNQ